MATTGSSATDRFGERLARAARAASDAGLAGLVATPGPTLFYLVGHSPPPMERLTLLVVSEGNIPHLLVPALERPAAEASAAASLLELHDWRDGEDPFEPAAKLLGGERYAITDQTWALHALGLQRAAPDATFVPTSEVLPLLRAVKDPDELAELRAAGHAADACFPEIVRRPFAGRTEGEIAADLSELLRAGGHEEAGFAIVASGPNGASPHHEAGGRVIQAGDAVVLDYGGSRHRYASDITRTVFVGEPTEEQRRVYETVRAAQQAAFEAVRPGVAAQEVDRAARRVIAEAGYGEFFIHRTGHGIGLETHEPPYIVEGDGTILEPGMTFSIEPGIYLPGTFGVRIEDQVAVTATGAERLNEATREPQIVG